MATKHANAFTAFGLARSLQYKKDLLSRPWSEADEARFSAEAAASLEKQTQIEQSDSMPFEMYRQHYLSRDRLKARRATH